MMLSSHRKCWKLVRPMYDFETAQPIENCQHYQALTVHQDKEHLTAMMSADNCNTSQDGY